MPYSSLPYRRATPKTAGWAAYAFAHLWGNMTKLHPRKTERKKKKKEEKKKKK
jgi:hypothetical protein